MTIISIPLEEKEEKEIEALAKKMKMDKPTVARKIIEIGIKEMKRQEALENVRLQKWTVWKAASYSGESYRSFLKMLRAENIPFPLSLEELKSELNDQGS